MKKGILSFVLSLLGMTMSISAQAQNECKLTIGAIGGVNLYREPLLLTDSGVRGMFPGGSLFFDYSVVTFGKGHFTVGAQIGGQSWRNGLYDLAAAPRLTVGWDLQKWFEMHFGLTSGLGYSNWRGGQGINSLGFSYSGFFGTRFYITKGFGITLETGYSDYTPDFGIGLVFRF